jgi:hypothetical protein
MEIIAQVANSTPVDNDAVGARMLDCDTNVSLLVIAATHGDALDYAQGNLSEEEFQARWLPTG